MGIGIEGLHGGASEQKEPPKIDPKERRFTFSAAEEDALREKLKRAGYSDGAVEKTVASQRAKIEAANKKIGIKAAGNEIDRQEMELQKQEELFAATINDDAELMAAIERRQRKDEENQYPN